MNLLKIPNPATGALLAELPADDASTLAAKTAAARAAQPAWAARPLAQSPVFGPQFVIKGDRVRKRLLVAAAAFDQYPPSLMDDREQ